MTKISPTTAHVHKHKRGGMLDAPLVETLRELYKKREARVVRGDSVKVMRGEYKGVEGKVEWVDTKRCTLTIEGVQREKVRGGQVKVPIHSSNVMLVGLNLADRYRSARIQRENPKEKLKKKPAEKEEPKIQEKRENED